MLFLKNSFYIGITCFLVFISFILFHTNCSVDDPTGSFFRESKYNNYGSDTTNTTNNNGAEADTSSSDTSEDNNNNEDGGDSDVSDFAWSKVTWLRDQDVSEWEESSQITSVEVRDDGAICIDHTERGQWPQKPSEEGGDVIVDGNPWVIVKLNGQYYASTYEWLRPDQLCKFELIEGLQALYDDVLGSHIKISPLKEWVPQGGEVIGFMVSGLARHQHTVPNVHKRTNIQWYRLPSVDGLIQGEMLHATFNSDDTTSSTTSTTISSTSPLSQRSDTPPNMLHIVQTVANNNNQVLKSSCRNGHENLDFLGLVLEELRKEDEGIRWGYNCKRGDCNQLSIDAIAYYRGTDDPNNSSDVAIFDIIASCHSDNPQAAWSDVTQATIDAGAIGRYKYPR